LRVGSAAGLFASGDAPSVVMAGLRPGHPRLSADELVRCSPWALATRNEVRMSLPLIPVLARQLRRWELLSLSF
jgi:hypothetical protein